MPNHITNRIKITGDPDTVKRILNKIKSDEFGVGTLDFEKIIPMPENIFRGNLGIREKELYSKNNWYDWSVANWGTKWNAYGFEPNTDHSKEKEIRFLTAWSAPHPILAKLSEMFPDIHITHEWADEDIGMNCGRRVYYDGERIEEYYPESKKDRLEFAARVMDIQLEEDCGLYLNASETEYIDIEGDDEYELIELFGQPALFTNDRITDADIPKGMHCYHIRHGDEGEFAAIEKRTEVNHAGSVVTREPIDLGEQGYISFAEETSPDFKGEIIRQLKKRSHVWTRRLKMHTNKIKAKVDFKFCMGSIPAMLRATKPVLSERQYKELCNEVNKADGYLEQKRIIFSYVDPIIKG